LYYECGLPGHQAASHRQKKGKKFHISAVARVLGAAQRPDPEGWEHGTQPPPYQEYESPEPKSEKKNEQLSERSSDNKEYPLLL
jgi:hypothetical protein